MATPSSPAPADPIPTLPPPLEGQTAGEQLYHAGTLTYNRKGLFRLFSWLLWGDLAWNIRDRALGEVINVFMRHVQASNSFIQFLLRTLPGIINSFLGPIVSYLSDRHRGKWGRRRPFLIIGVPLAALCIIGMGLSTFIGHWLHDVFPRYGPTQWSLGCFAVFFIAYDVAAVLSGSVFGAFFNDVVPREVLGRFWGFVRAVSIAVQIVFMLGVLGYADRYLSQIFVAVGIIYGIGFTSSVLIIKEGEYPPPEDIGASGRGLGAVFLNIGRGIVSYFKVCFSKPFYLWVFAAMILPNTLAFASIYMWTQFFATKGVHLTLDNYAKLTALYFILSLPLQPLLGWLCDKIHPLRVAIVVLALHVPASLWGWFYVDDGRSFAIAFVCTGLLQVLWGTATAALWPMLFPKATFAQLSSASGVIATVLGIGYGQLLAAFLDRVGSIYQYTFLAAGLLDLLGLYATIVVYQKFSALGGQKNYVAP